MISSRTRGVVWLGALVGIMLAAAAIGACASSDSTSATASTLDATPGGGEGGDATAPEDGGLDPDDGGLDATRDANSRDASARDANGPGVALALCSFNWDCQSALRCECDEATGCACKPGARGTGRNGIDPCTSGNACTSAVCVEGPPDSGSFCSDECVTSADCAGKLPLCQTISFVGRICIRTP